MKIIILEGHRSTGKTTTLQMVYAVLFSSNAIVNNFSIIQHTNDKDFEVELNIPSQNKNVVIHSKGDNQTDCYKAISKYANKNIDVLILAYSDFKNALNTSPHSSKVINKTIVFKKADELQANADDCKIVISNI